MRSWSEMSELERSAIVESAARPSAVVLVAPDVMDAFLVTGPLSDAIDALRFAMVRVDKWLAPGTIAVVQIRP